MVKAFRLAMCCVLLAGIPMTKAKAETPEETIAKLELDVEEAIVKKDIKVLEKAFADDYFNYDFTSVKKHTKAEVIASIMSPDSALTAYKYTPFDIRIFGSTAIVQGTVHETWTYKGKDASFTSTWLDVLEKRDGHWVFVANECAKVIE